MGNFVGPSINMGKGTSLETISHTLDATNKIASIRSVRRMEIVHLHDDLGAITLEDHTSEKTFNCEASHIVESACFCC
jgi:hypothetical protein